MVTTTLNEIKSLAPNRALWETLLNHLGKTQADDEPLPLVTVLDATDLDFTIWCLRVCPGPAVEFAQWCADEADKTARVADAAKAARSAGVVESWWTARATCWRAHVDPGWGDLAADSARMSGADLADWVDEAARIARDAKGTEATEIARAIGRATKAVGIGMAAWDAEYEKQTAKLGELLS